MFDPVQEYSSDNRVVDENSMRKRYLALGLEDYDLTSLFLSAIDRQETGENSQVKKLHLPKLMKEISLLYIYIYIYII